MPAKWSTSVAIPNCSISASTLTSGSSTSASSWVAPRASRSASSASASSAVPLACWASAFAASAGSGMSSVSWPEATVASGSSRFRYRSARSARLKVRWPGSAR